MLSNVKKEGMVKTREEGYQKVLDTTDGTFAFIDEAARVIILEPLSTYQILITHCSLQY